jgi:hypothetical protein
MTIGDHAVWNIDKKTDWAVIPRVLDLRDILELSNDGFDDRALPKQQTFRHWHQAVLHIVAQLGYQTNIEGCELIKKNHRHHRIIRPKFPWDSSWIFSCVSTNTSLASWSPLSRTHVMLGSLVETTLIGHIDSLPAICTSFIMLSIDVGVAMFVKSLLLLFVTRALINRERSLQH